MNRIFIPILAMLLSGCATMASIDNPTVSQPIYEETMNVPDPENGKIVLAVYQFGDLTGQQKPNDNFGEMSKAITQGSSQILIKALKDVGAGKWFRIVERESLQSLLQERKLIRTTRQMTQGEAAKPLGPMLYAGAYLTGGIVGYDANYISGGLGARYLGIGAHAEYRKDTLTVVLRLVNVVTSEVEMAIMVEKTVFSTSIGSDVFKYLDADTQLVEIEAGIAKNEPVTYAVRKAIEASVVELIAAGEKKGLWKYKPEPEGFDAPVLNKDDQPGGDNYLGPVPVCDPPCPDGEDGSATITEEEIEEVLEELIEADDEIRTEAKEKASQPELEVNEVEAEKQEIPEEVFTQKLLDELECGVNPYKLMFLEKNEKTSDNDSAATAADR